MSIGSLLEAVSTLEPRARSPLPAADTEVAGLAHDSRRVRRGDVFICLRGRERDSHAFAADAFAAGAILVLGEADTIVGEGPYLQVSDSRAALSCLATTFHTHPSRRMVVVAITGTNGKTSVSFMLHAIWRSLGIPSAVAGTLGVGRPPHLLSSGFTTPEATELQAMLARLYREGVRALAMEVSSHALELRRSFGTRFHTAVFTNLSADHQDFHGSMEVYAGAKNRLFRAEERGIAEPPLRAVVNADDPWCEAILRGSRDRVLRFGRSALADVRPVALSLSMSGITMRIAHPEGETDLHSPLLGTFQVENLLAAFATGLSLGFHSEAIARGLSQLSGVPGRMERIDAGQSYLVVVDFAHTSEALEKALASLRPFTPGRLLLVFGCGGERDRAKRPAMGRVAGLCADFVVLTDDNPRREDPEAIRREVREGLLEVGARFVEEGDRAVAIERAFREAAAGDIVLVAGKGAETLQQRGDHAVPFDDRRVARDTLLALGSSTTVRTDSASIEGAGGEDLDAGEWPSWTLGEIERLAGGRLTIEASGATGATGATDADGLAEAAALESTRASTVSFDRLSTDSRTLQAGNFFVALRGERFDGHDSLGLAIERGALAALVHRASEDSLFPEIVVDDSLAGLQRWSAAHRRSWRGGPLLALTGSSGKTTAKDLLSHLLAGVGPVHATRGNLNNHVGVPLTLLGLAPSHRAAVVELGMNHEGEIRALSHLAAPTMAIVTAIGLAHVGHLGSREAILRAKLEIVDGLDASAPLVLPHDPWVLDRLPESVRSRPLTTFGVSPAASWHPVGPVEWSLLGTRFTTPLTGPIEVPLLGEGALYSSLAALAAAEAAGFDVRTLASRLETAPRRSLRMEPRVRRDVTWLLDCYNASPESTEFTLRFGATVPHAGRRFLVFGQLGELGAHSSAIHEALGRSVLGYECVWFVGQEARIAYEACPLPQKFWCKDTLDVTNTLDKILAPFDLVVLKGSRRTALERIFEQSNWGGN